MKPRSKCGTTLLSITMATDQLFQAVYEALIDPNREFRRPELQTPQHFLYKLFKSFKALYRKDYKEAKNVLIDLQHGITLEEAKLIDETNKQRERHEERLRRESREFEDMYDKLELGESNLFNPLKRRGSCENTVAAKKICDRRKTIAEVREALQFTTSLPPYCSPFPLTPVYESGTPAYEPPVYEPITPIYDCENKPNETNEIVFVPSYQPSVLPKQHGFSIPSPYSDVGSVTPTSVIPSPYPESVTPPITPPTPQPRTKTPIFDMIYTDSEEEEEVKKTTPANVVNESSEEEEEEEPREKLVARPRRVRKKSPKGIAFYVENKEIVCMIGGVSYINRQLKNKKEILINSMIVSENKNVDINGIWTVMSDTIVSQFRKVTKRNKRISFHTIDYKNKIKSYIEKQLVEQGLKFY